MENVQLSWLHEDSKGYFTIAKMGKTWRQYYFDDINSMTINIADNDVYISQNTFENKSRKLIHLKELKALYIDIDCYKMNLTKEAARYFMEKDLYGVIPIPNMLIDSGRGLYYIIFLDKTEAKDLPKWQIVERFLFEKLKDVGSDAKALDATKVLRITGSTNSKSNSEVKIIEEYNYNYSLDEIIENYIPEIIENQKEIQKPKGVKKKGRKKKIVSLYNLYTLYYTRIEDIKTLVEFRNYNMTGCREITLFLLRYFLNIYCNDDEKSLEEILEINNSFTEPLSESEVIKATSSALVGAKENKYKYSNDKLIKLLDITPLEQKEMATIISKSEKYYRNNRERRLKRRNEEGLTKREQDKINKLNKIKELKEKKYTNNDIAKIMNMNEKQIKRYVKEIKEAREN